MYLTFTIISSVNSIHISINVQSKVNNKHDQAAI